MATDVSDLRERVGSLPGMSLLLDALVGLPPAYLVGGGVRDLLRGASAVDLDVALEGDAVAAARVLAERLGGEAKVHERFGTATVAAEQVTVDLAATRRERYARPGELPQVEPATLADDLARRDFTINAMAVGLSGDDLGGLHDPLGGRADLDRRLVRVLHDRSFTDDPTRLLRALRYEARLAGSLEPHTEELARAAIAAGAPRTVSGPRIRDELLDLLADPARKRALERVSALRLDAALDPALSVDATLAYGAADEATHTGAEPRLAALAALISADPDALASFLEGLALPAAQRDRVARAARRGPTIARDSATPGLRPSHLHALLAGEPPEALALALALGAPRESIERYLDELRDVRLEVDGDDLRAAGVPPSRALGRALEETLRRKLDGEVSGRDAELALALALARGDGQ